MSASLVNVPKSVCAQLTERISYKAGQILNREAKTLEYIELESQSQILTSASVSSVNTVKVIMTLCKDHVPTTVCFSYFSVSTCDIKCFETEMVLLIDNLCEQHVY